MVWKKLVFISLIFMLLMGGCSGTQQSELTPTVEIQPTVTRFPPTLTFTPIPFTTPTTIPSYTPTSPASALYYMIVVDASLWTKNEFGGQLKLDVFRELARSIMDGLEPQANYGLVVIGGSAAVSGIDPCGQPSVAQVPFTSRTFVENQLVLLQPDGGGSMTSAFLLARRQFEGLSADTVRGLIMITDTTDECRSENEWSNLLGLYKVMDEAGLEFHSEIIVVDEGISNGLKTSINQITQANKKVNFHLVQSDTSLSETRDKVLGNLQTYASSIVASRPTATLEPLNSPTSETSLPTNTLGASSFTLTPRETTPTFTPSITLTPVPQTVTATLTPSLTPTPTSTLPPSVELLSYKFLTYRIGCQIDIVVKVTGSAATGSFHVMNSSNEPQGEVSSEVTLPTGTYGNNSVVLTGSRPETYSHDVWFTYNGTETNRLTNIVCPLVPTATSAP